MTRTPGQQVPSPDLIFFHVGKSPGNPVVKCNYELLCLGACRAGVGTGMKIFEGQQVSRTGCQTLVSITSGLVCARSPTAHPRPARGLTQTGRLDSGRDSVLFCAAS